MGTQVTATDNSFLKLARRLAGKGRGRVSPNPLVGAVLVRGGEVIGEGWHAELGQLHAERAALEDCARRGEDAAGATMYVTLEPCAHQGRQPPCVEAILEAGIGRVVIGSEDPGEKASGRGPGILRDGGVEVAFAAGSEAAAARLLNQPFRKHARTGIPHVVLKLAISLDGRTSTAPGDSPWISGPASRALVHRWRAESDAIAAGICTVLADDPLLTARPEPAALPTDAPPRQPTRIVFDSAARLPVDSQLLSTLDQSPVILVVGPRADPTRLEALRAAGADILLAPGAAPTDRVTAALAELGRRDVTSLFLEGGQTLAQAFLAADQIDESRTFIAPVLLRDSTDATRPGGAVGGTTPEEALATAGGGGSPAATGPARLAALDSRVERIGDDTLITARLKEW